MTNEYEGHWITTYTGKKVHYLDPKPEEIDIEDIAHALSLTCRFGGHCNRFYSVAEHSVRVSEIVPSELQLQALLHDAHEAYLPDIPRPIKGDIPNYAFIAKGLQEAIDTKFLGGSGMCKAIKHADNVLLATEARDLMSTTEDWAELPTPLVDKIFPWEWDTAEYWFLSYFGRLTREKNGN